jgi:RNA-binding protein
VLHPTQDVSNQPTVFIGGLRENLSRRFSLANACPAGFHRLMQSLTSAERRKLKGRAQLLEPTVLVGKLGLSPQVVAALDAALQSHELVKVRFDEFKDQRKELARQLAARTQSHLVTLIGHVAVLYRPELAASGTPADSAGTAPEPETAPRPPR